MPESAYSVVLPASVDIATVIEVKTILTDAIQGGHSIELDAQQLTRVDATGAQLMYAFVRHCTGLHKPVRWVHASERIRDTFRCLGLDREVGL